MASGAQIPTIGTGKLLKWENLSSMPLHNTVTCLQQPGNKGTFREMVSRKKEPIQVLQSEQVEDYRADDRAMEGGHEGQFFCPEPIKTARDHFNT